MQQNLKILSDTNLDQQFMALAFKEREILSSVLLHIIEVERRKLYLQMAFPNLFEYMTKHLKYSAGSAQRRIEAARLSKEVPVILDKIEDGHINLAQIGIVQKAVRHSQSDSKQRVPQSVKADLIEKIQNKSFQESEILVHQALNIPIKSTPQVKHQQDESVRLEVTLSKEQWQKLNKMRELLSHSLPDGSWDKVFEYVSDKVIQQKDKARSVKAQSESDLSKIKTVKRNPDSFTNKEFAQSPTALQLTSTDPKLTSVTQSHRQYVPQNIQRATYQRDQCCQFTDPLTNRKCTSTWKLTIDHIRPIWAGGQNDIQNLRLLCANHNRQLYRNQARIRSG